MGYVSGIANWDINTFMPEEGATGRGEALAKVSTLSQKVFLDKEFVELINAAEKEENLKDEEKGVLRVLKKDLASYTKLPPEFIEEFERTTNEAHMAWRKAQSENCFSLFSTHLEKIVELTRRKADYLGYEDHPYDALINEFEEGWTKTI